MNVLLTGGSGFIGQHISKALHLAGHQVKGVSRSNGYDFNRMITKGAWLPLLTDIDIVINSVGIITETTQQTFATLHYQAPSALFQASAESDIKKVIQISALGADENAFTPYQTSKAKADNVLRALALNSFVLRPSFVYGRGGKSMEMFKKLSAFSMLPLVDGGEQMIQPIYIDDLTDTVLQCINSTKSNITIDLVGAHAISFKDWLQLMRRKKGKTEARIIPVPFKLSMALAKLGKHIIPIMHPDNLRMLKKGNIADVKPLVKFIGRMPLDIETGWSKL